MLFFKKQNLIIGILATVFFSASQIVFAVGMDQSENVYLKISPEYPQPNSTVMASVESYSTDLNRAEISWFQNNKLQKKGVGEIKFNFEANASGLSNTITVQINDKNLGVVSKSITFIPAEMDLLWEAETFIPPFYKGKSLSSYQSPIRIIATPNLPIKVDPNEIIYTWKKGWKVLGSKSGYGKRVLELSDIDLLGDNLITVFAETTDKKYKVSGNLFLDFYNPQIIFYKKDPLLGTIFEKSLSGEYNLVGQEVSLIAEPFFFSISDIKNKKLEYEWFMNNEKIETPEKENLLVLRNKKNDAGETKIGIKIRNEKRIMENGEINLMIKFGESVKNNLFSF